MAASAYGIFAPIEPEFRIRRLIIIGPFVLTLLVLKQLLNKGYVRSDREYHCDFFMVNVHTAQCSLAQTITTRLSWVI